MAKEHTWLKSKGYDEQNDPSITEARRSLHSLREGKDLRAAMMNAQRLRMEKEGTDLEGMPLSEAKFKVQFEFIVATDEFDTKGISGGGGFAPPPPNVKFEFEKQNERKKDAQKEPRAHPDINETPAGKRINALSRFFNDYLMKEGFHVRSGSWGTWGVKKVNFRFITSIVAASKAEAEERISKLVNKLEDSISQEGNSVVQVKNSIHEEIREEREEGGTLFDPSYNMPISEAGTRLDKIRFDSHGWSLKREPHKPISFDKTKRKLRRLEILIDEMQKAETSDDPERFDTFLDAFSDGTGSLLTVLSREVFEQGESLEEFSDQRRGEFRSSDNYMLTFFHQPHTFFVTKEKQSAEPRKRFVTNLPLRVNNEPLKLGGVDYTDADVLTQCRIILDWERKYIDEVDAYFKKSEKARRSNTED